MPRTSFEFEVSTDKPKAIVVGPDYLSKPIASLFRQKGLSVQTNLAGQPPGAVDYIVDIDGSKNTINLAVETGAKYLRVLIGQEPQHYQDNLNWRTLQTNFIVGPEIPESTLMGNLIRSAIRNNSLVLPPSDVNLYPLHVNDLAEACWQALVIPNTSKKQFTALGDQVTSQRLGNFLENLGQTTKGIETSPSLNYSDYDLEQIEISRQNLNWQPKLGWQETIKKGFQSLWEVEKENIDQQLTSVSSPKPEPEPETPPIPEPQPKPIAPSTIPDQEDVIIIEETAPDKSPKKEGDEDSKVEEIAAEFKKKTVSKQDELVWWHPIAIILFLGISFVISVWLKPTIRLGLGVWQINKAYAQLTKQNWETSLIESQKAKDNFTEAERFLENSQLSSLFFGYQQLMAKGAELGRKTASAAENAAPLLKNGLTLSESILKNKMSNQNEAIEQLTNYQNTLDYDLKEIQAQLQGSWPGIPGRWQNTPNEWSDKIDTYRKKITKANQVLPHLPWIIGLNNQRRTYLVLLQNNMELRPTGGFIGSFALLTFENGKLSDFQVEDVYTADGQLKGHVEPPEVIKEILGEAKWYLRDSNWSPHFPKSAENAEWFLEKELNRTVDGVIGINLEAAKKLISAFGEIYLADFNERISADNIFERAEFWSENESFPGSNQKAAFLGLLGRQLFENIKAAQPEEYAKIGQAFLESLEEKEIIVDTHNDQLNMDLHELNWNGSMRSPECKITNCHTDYIHLNEANLGVNKANYFLRRSIEEGIDILDDGTIDHNLKISYENSATSKNWPGGDYVAWLRAYLPTGTTIGQISIYDPQNPANKEIINPEKRQEEIEFGKEMVGFKIEVPIQERRTVEFNYSQKAEISEERFGYFLYWQKQSGFRNTPLSLLVSFPDTWQPLQVNPSANVISGKLLFNQQLNHDLNFGIQFSN
jgi:hypothetical protein